MLYRICYTTQSDVLCAQTRSSFLQALLGVSLICPSLTATFNGKYRSDKEDATKLLTTRALLELLSMLGSSTAFVSVHVIVSVLAQLDPLSIQSQQINHDNYDPRIEFTRPRLNPIPQIVIP